MDDLMNQMLMTHPSASMFYDPFFDADLPLLQQGIGQQQQLTSGGDSGQQQDQSEVQGGQQQQQQSGQTQTQLATQQQGGELGLGLGQLFPTGLVKVDVHEDKDNFHLSAEIPGVPKENVSVNVNDGYLTISGEKKEVKKDEKEEQGRKIRRSERRYGSFQRSFRLPPTCDQEKVQAKFDNGVLQVCIPKTAQEQPKGRQIQIQ
jgi:HSP20 family protein